MSKSLLLAMLVTLAASSGLAGDQREDDAGPRTLTCEPSAAVVPDWVDADLKPPELGVVDCEIRPKRARLYLNGAYLGLARDFDGYPGLLYLTPGQYILEARLAGYRPVAFAVEARPSCGFRVRHRLERIAGEAKERRTLESPGQGWERARVWTPSGPWDAAEAPTRPAAAGPDMSLRPDLRTKKAVAQGAVAGASIKLAVEPTEAAIYVDDAFVATGGEIATMVNPLSVAPGTHRIDVVAPGYRSETREIEIVSGQTLEVIVILGRVD
jgi:hypothetical protein